MKALKYIFILIITLLGLSACSDELEVRNGIDAVPEGYLRFSISLPELQKIQTRNGEKEDELNERKITSLTLLIFDDAGKLMLNKGVDVNSFRDGENNYKNSFEIKYGNINTRGNESVFLIANYDLSSFQVNDENSNLDKLNQFSDNSLTTENRNFIMSGKLRGTLSTTATNSIELFRTAAKVTLTGTDVNLVQIGNSASSGFLTAYHQEPSYKSDGNATIPPTSPTSNIAYIYPTMKDNAFMIVKAKYENIDYFYKVAFLKKDETGKDVALEIKPNYWYEVSISNINSKGYARIEDAMTNPPSNLEVEIHDHAPEVYSLASDGLRELGVMTPIVRTKAEPSIPEENLYLSVKLFSAYEDEKDLNLQAVDIKVSEALINNPDKDKLVIDYSDISSWFEIDSEFSHIKNGNLDFSSDSDSEDKDQTAWKGKVLNFPIQFSTNNSIDDLEGEIKVYWKGLERRVKVEWKKSFDPTSMSEVTLKIHKSLTDNNPLIIEDYWKFLSGKGESHSQSGGKQNTPLLYGLGENSLSPTKIRNKGFHFPVMYGDDDIDRWWYEYEISLLNSTDNIESCEFTFSGNPDLKNGLKIKNNLREIDFSSSNTVTIPKNQISEKFSLFREASADNYDYLTGVLTITLITEDNQKRIYEFDLYHTGFFHYDDNTKRIVTPTPGAYYYYEVIKLDGSNNEFTYWLDRNIGATSAALYIQDGNGENIVGETWPYNSGGKGGYYTFNDAPCPPGYRIPTKGEWDNIRHSSRFINEERISALENSSVTYYTSFFSPTGNEAVSFSKSRYYNKKLESMMGDAFGGYYWTSTPDYDNWNKVLYLVGASSYYGLGDKKEYGMSVRCVSNGGGNITTTEHTISFNITGATHVYLYKYNSEGRTGIFSWPGKAIGNAMSMSVGGNYNLADFYRDKVINFNYTSTTDPKDLYVLFNFVTDDGLIYTYTSNLGNGTDINPSDAKGWKVVEGGSYLFEFDISTNTGKQITYKKYEHQNTGTVIGQDEEYHTSIKEDMKDTH